MSATPAPSRRRDPAGLAAALRFVWRQLRESPGGFVVGGIGSLLFAGMTILSSVVLGEITDRVLLDPGSLADPTTAALVGAAVVFAVALFKAVGVVARRLGAYHSQYGLQAGDRRLVTRRFLSLGLPWHRRHATGTLLSNASSDVETAAFIAAPLPMALGVVVMVAVTAVMLVATDLWLALVGFVVGPAIAGANYYFARRMRNAARRAQSTRGDVAEVAHESFDAALVVKTLGRERAEIARFDDETGRLRDHLITLARLRATFDPVIQAIPNLGILAVLLVGAWRVEQGALSAGALVTFAYLFRLVAMPTRVIGWLLALLPQAMVGFERVSAVLDADEDMHYGTAALGDHGPLHVEMDDVTYLHPASERRDLDGGADEAGVPVPAATATPDAATPDTAADGHPAGDGHAAHAARPGDDDAGPRGVVDLAADLAPGATLAVVGATGAGKTTLSSLLVRLFDPDDGEVRADGLALPRLDRQALADAAVLVFQDAFLFDTSIRENITLGRDVADEEVVAAARLAQADGFVRELDHGYDTVVGERGASLSGGQRQRIALARALVRRPRLLVLDDATSAVDPTVEQAILAGLATADRNMTVVVVAYRRGSISLADEVLFLADGQVVDRGPHDELMAHNAAYADLVAAYDADGERRDRGQVGGVVA